MTPRPLAFGLALALAPTPLPAQAVDPLEQVEPQTESGEASGGSTGFLRADGFRDLPDAAPVPTFRPDDPEVRADGDPGDVALIDDVPAPVRRPSAEADPDRRDAPLTATPGDMPDPDALPPVYRRLAETDEAFAACTARLSALGARFEPAAPVTTARDPDCGIARPLAVAEIAPGVALRPDAVMRCATAVALAEWVSEAVLPAAGELTGAGRLSAINHGSTYICRRRNNRPTGKLSEHSFGNAVDVMGFEFTEGDALRIEPREPGSGPEARFQRRVREASCEHFTTVLGPGSNAAHADHLHLDVKQRRGGYRLCE